MGYYKHGIWRPSRNEISGPLPREWPPRVSRHYVFPGETNLGILPGKMKTLYMLYLKHTHPELTPDEVSQELETIEKTGKSLYLKNES